MLDVYIPNFFCFSNKHFQIIHNFIIYAHYTLEPTISNPEPIISCALKTDEKNTLSVNDMSTFTDSEYQTQIMKVDLQICSSKTLSIF